MNLSRTQIIIIASVLAIVVFLVLIFLGVIPGLRNNQAVLSGTISFWGMEDKSVFDSAINDFIKLHSGVKITYRQIDAGNYESALVDALASGKGPDVFEVWNTWLPKHYNKLSQFSETDIPLNTFRDIFPRVAEQDFAPSGAVFALPLYVDTLALYYNQDIFDNAGVVSPPSSWDQFVNLIPKLRKLGTSGRIDIAGAAMGGSNKSVDRASDILSALMLQSGVAMTDSDFTKATFASDIGKEALNFYLRFSNPNDAAFTWSDSFNDSLSVFSGGKAAMMINYLYASDIVKAKNPLLNFRLAFLPQPAGQSVSVNFPSYLGLGAYNQSKSLAAAEQFILYATTNASEAEAYLKASGHPPALRVLIQKYSNDPKLSIFARQALTARSWPQIDDVAVARVLSSAISDALSGRLTSDAALEQAENEVTTLMSQRIR